MTLIGGGGIAEALLRLLAPMRTRVTVVRRHPEPMEGAAAVVGSDGLMDAREGVDGVVLALRPGPRDNRRHRARRSWRDGISCWLVNVARGAHVDTDALVAALAGRHDRRRPGST